MYTSMAAVACTHDQVSNLRFAMCVINREPAFPDLDSGGGDADHPGAGNDM